MAIDAKLIDSPALNYPPPENLQPSKAKKEKSNILPIAASLAIPTLIVLGGYLQKDNLPNINKLLTWLNPPAPSGETRSSNVTKTRRPVVNYSLEVDITTKADLVKLVEFVNTPSVNNPKTKIIPWTESTKREIADDIETVADYCLGIGVNQNVCDHVFRYTNVSLVEDPEDTSHAFLGRIGIDHRRLNTTIHEYMHRLNGLFAGTNGSQSSGTVEGIATLSEYRAEGKVIPPPRPEVLKSVKFKYTGEYYEAAAYALGQVEEELQQFKFKQTGEIIPIDTAFANSYHDWSSKSIDRMWHPMPAKDLFFSLDKIYGTPGASYVAQLFNKYPILGLSIGPTPPEKNPTQIIPPRGKTPTPAQQQPKGR